MIDGDNTTLSSNNFLLLGNPIAVQTKVKTGDILRVKTTDTYLHKILICTHNKHKWICLKTIFINTGTGEELKNVQSDFNNFVNKFMDKQSGLIADPKGYHRSLAVAMH